jgi:uncharacterized protein (TIGR02001 family)
VPVFTPESVIPHRSNTKTEGVGGLGGEISGARRADRSFSGRGAAEQTGDEMMNFRKAAQLAVAAGLAGAAMTGAAWAQDEPAGPKIAFNFGAATDYVFRGVSQTNEKTQGFVGADVTYNQFYAGAWTSNVDFSEFGDTRTTQEVDLYAGVRPTLGPINLDLGVLYYGYLKQPKGVTVDYWELAAKATHAMGPATIGASVFWSPEFTGKTGDAWYYEGNLAYTVTPKVSLSGALGRQEIEFGTDYTTWNAGITFMPVSNVSFDVRYVDTDVQNIDAYKGRVVATLKAMF